VDDLKDNHVNDEVNLDNREIELRENLYLCVTKKRPKYFGTEQFCRPHDHVKKGENRETNAHKGH